MRNTICSKLCFAPVGRQRYSETSPKAPLRSPWAIGELPLRGAFLYALICGCQRDNPTIKIGSNRQKSVRD